MCTCCVPCSLLCVLLRGQFASISSATQVRLFLPCSRKVQSSRERSKALLVSSPTSLHWGILPNKTNILYSHVDCDKVHHTEKCTLGCEYYFSRRIAWLLLSPSTWTPWLGISMLDSYSNTDRERHAELIRKLMTVIAILDGFKAGHGTRNDSHCLSTVSYLCSEANKRHVGVAHRYQVSQLLVEGTHFPGPLRLFGLWVPLITWCLHNNKGWKKKQLTDFFLSSRAHIFKEGCCIAVGVRPTHIATP